MNSKLETSDYISELISYGYSSLARENGQGNFKTFRKLDKGLNFLENNACVQSEDVSKSVVVLKILVDLRDNIIHSKHVKDSQVPNIYRPANSLNNLLVKSAMSSIKVDDPNLITKQCEKFLNIADEIRKDKKLKGLGLLDGRLKNTIGKLRKKSSIESIFSNKEFEEYDKLVEAATDILSEGTLIDIGKKIIELGQIAENMDTDFAYRSNFLKYIRRFKHSYNQKIKTKTNTLVKKSYSAGFFDSCEILDILLSMEKLDVYHQQKGLTIMLRQMQKKIKATRITPLEKILEEMKLFIVDNIHNASWQSYESKYQKKYNEGELFFDTFYDSTLKGCSIKDAVILLREKLMKLKGLSLKEMRHITFEQDFIALIEKTIHVFDNLSFSSNKKQFLIQTLKHH